MHELEETMKSLSFIFRKMEKKVDKMVKKDLNIKIEDTTKESNSVQKLIENDNCLQGLNLPENLILPPEKYWTENILPLSYYLNKIRNNIKVYKYFNKSEQSENVNLNIYKPKYIARILTQIDINLLQKLKPSDMVTYDGIEYTNINILYLKNKNKGLINFVSFLLRDEEYQGYFIKVLKYLKKEKNFNSIDCIMKAFQRHKLKKNILSKLTFNTSYFDLKTNISNLVKQNEIFVYPFNLFIKDLTDSNRNQGNEEASEKFCNLMEILVKLQNSFCNLNFKIDKKVEHFLFFNFYKFLDSFVISKKSCVDDLLVLFL